MKSVTRQNMLWALHGALVAVLTGRGIRYRTVQPHEWRHAVLGKGRMTSADAKRAAVRLAQSQGIEVSSHDEAEAFAMLVYLAQCHRLWQIEIGRRLDVSEDGSVGFSPAFEGK